MIKWNFMKLLLMFLWILLKESTIADEILAVDINGDANSQTLWQPTTTIAEVNDDQHILPSLDNLPQPYDESIWNSKAEPVRRRRRPGSKRKQQQQRLESIDEFSTEMQYNGFQPALTKPNEQTSINIAVSATQSFNEQNSMPIRIDQQQTNEWKAISIDDIVQSPVLQVQTQFTVDEAVTGDEADLPHHEPWIQRERLSAAPSPSSVARTEEKGKNKSFRRTYSMAHRHEELKEHQQQATNDSNKTAANLKSILKQSASGLSLSEILQQQNLSLDDLLRGKQTALKALQNTAAPPADEKGINSIRRLPSIVQMNIIPPRRNFHNGTTRFSNFHRPDSNAELVQSLDASKQQSIGEVTMARKRLASTIPTFSEEIPRLVQNRDAFVASESNELPSVQRMPPFRGKTIKEVVSAIRPDLNNSNLRKRLPSLKSLQSKSNAQITYTVETKLEQKELNSTVASVTVNNTAIESSINTTIGNEQTTATNTNENHVIRVKTNDAEISSSTTENLKLSFRERLALRPPSPRNANQLPISRSTEFPIPTQSILITTTSNKVATTSEEPLLPYTIITFTTSTEPSELVSSNQPMDEFNRKLNESVPESNLVDLKDESKSKEVTSLEELFFTDAQADDTNSETSSDRLDDIEFMHTSTSRSDKLYNKSEKPSSQKMFGGNFMSIFKKSLIKLDVTERNPSLFTDIVQSKLVDDKTELLDLLGDRRSGARLVKVLKQRNMTVDELIEHRKRGSSQLHLAEIFHNRTKITATESDASPPTKKPTQQHQKLDVVTAFEHFPEFSLESVKSVNPDEIKTDSQGSSYFTSIVNIRPTAEVFKEGRSIRKPFLIKIAESATRYNIPTQHWNTDHQIDSSSPHSIDHNFLDSSRVTVFTTRRAPPIIRPLTGDDSSISAFEEIVDQNGNDAAARSHDPLDLELSGHGYKRNSVLIENAQMPIGVRSAIVASASIVLISLTIFIVIFLVCRWQQKRRRKICYSDRFQAIRGRLPILISRDGSPSKRSTSPPIAYCAGSSRRSSKLNTMDPNSPEVQEYLYDAMRKPFQ